MKQLTTLKMTNLIKRIIDKFHRKPFVLIFDSDIVMKDPLVKSTVSENMPTEVKLKNHGWQKLLSQGEYGTHEGLNGIYYLVEGFGKVHEKYCLDVR